MPTNGFNNQAAPRLRQSLGKLILDARQYKRSALTLCGMLAIALLGNYLTLIYPVFLAADINNPAVEEFLSSETYRNAMSLPEVRREFSPPSNHMQARDDRSNFLISDRTRFGFVVVSVYYRVVPASDEGPSPRSDPMATGHPGFTHKPEFTVRPNMPLLILFVICEAGILIGITFFSITSKTKMELEFEEKEIRTYLGLSDTTQAIGPIETLMHVLRQFHTFAGDLQRPRAGRPVLEIKDESDVQHLLYALLKMNFADVQREEPSPSFAGGASRIDFLLRDLGIAIEVKMIRDNMRDRELGEELMTDITRYFEHPKCKLLVFFIYDPHRRFGNAVGLRRDLAELDSRVQVIFSPIE